LELQREIAGIFYRLVDLTERRKILIRLDSVYSRFNEAAQFRLQAGEANRLESSSAALALQQWRLQLSELNADYRILQKQLQWLLQTVDWIEPDYEQPRKKSSYSLVVDSSLNAQHPRLGWWKAIQAQEKGQTLMEKSKLLPSLTVGYANQSITGYQTLDGISETYFSRSRRFSLVNITLGLPLFNKVTKARIRAGQRREEAVALQAEAERVSLQYELSQSAEELRKRQQQLDLFEISGKENADRMIRNAELAYRQGEIGYLEWTVLINQATQWELGYLDAIKGYNQALIEFEFLNGKIEP
jgi:cobalt-zinc-cadmium resistance protein CzcA